MLEIGAKIDISDDSVLGDGEKLVNNRLNWSFGTFILTSDMWKQSEGWKGTFKYGLFLTYYLVEYVHISVEFCTGSCLKLNLVINAFFFIANCLCI